MKTFHVKQGENGLYTFKISGDKAAIRYRFKSNGLTLDNRSVMNTHMARSIYKALIESGAKRIK